VTVLRSPLFGPLRSPLRSPIALRKGGGALPAVFTLIESEWFADTADDATADGYAVSDGDGGYVIDDEAVSGLPVLVRGSRVFLEI